MRKVTWSKESEYDFDDNIEYLIRKWTEKEAQNFIDKVNEIVDILEKGNAEFKKTHYKDLRAVTVTNQIILLYRTKSKKEVEIVRFWNTYQDPKKLKD